MVLVVVVAKGFSQDLLRLVLCFLTLFLLPFLFPLRLLTLLLLPPRLLWEGLAPEATSALLAACLTLLAGRYGISLEGASF